MTSPVTPATTAPVPAAPAAPATPATPAAGATRGWVRRVHADGPTHGSVIPAEGVAAAGNRAARDGDDAAPRGRP